MPQTGDKTRIPVAGVRGPKIVNPSGAADIRLTKLGMKIPTDISKNAEIKRRYEYGFCLQGHTASRKGGGGWRNFFFFKSVKELVSTKIRQNTEKMFADFNNFQ